MHAVRTGDVDADMRSALARLSVTPDGDEHILGRPDRGLYVAVPEPGAVLVNALRAGASLAEATKQASAAAGEEVDGADFLTGLAETGLLSDVSALGATKAPVGRRIRWLDAVQPRIVRPLFGRTAWVVYVAAAVGAVALLLVRTDLQPSFEDFWFLSDPMWSLLALTPIFLCLAAGHECWHWLAGRARGVPARFRMSRRGIFLVFETDLSPLVTLPRRQRYSPMLAGMAFDSVVLGFALLLRLGFREEVLHFDPTLDRLLGAIAMRQVIALAWQLCGIAFRSDGYAVLANVLGCHNLYRATWLTTRYRVWRLSRHEADELEQIGPHDRAVAGWFGLVFVAGGIAMVLWLFNYVFPFVLGIFNYVRPNLAAGAPETVAFWQSLVFVLLLATQYVAIPLIAVWEARLRKAGRLS